MHSLRQRLIWSLAAVLSVVWVIGGGVAYVWTKDALESELERSLVQQLGQVAPLVALELFTRERLGHQPVSETALHNLWVQAWEVDGTSILRSALLEPADLPRPQLDRSTAMAALDARHVTFSDLHLPDGRPARGVAARIRIPAPHQRRFSPATPAVQEIDVLLVQSRETVARPLRVLVWLFLVVSALSLGCLAWAGRWLVHRELRPLNDLRAQIATVEPAGLAAPIELSSAPMELAPVRDQLNAMLARLDAAFRREKEFAAHAAHELNTPLAALQATIEVALATPATPLQRDAGTEDERTDALRACHRLTLQMNTTVRALLDLVRPGARAAVPLDLVTLATEGSAQLEGAHRIEIEPPPTPLEPPPVGDPEPMRRVLHNLLTNALAYGDGTVRVSFRSEGARAAVAVHNRVQRIHPELEERAFETFWRADPARHDQHVGLGLSLCRSLVERMAGSIELRAEGGEVTVTVFLPRAAASAGSDSLAAGA